MIEYPTPATLGATSNSSGDRALDTALPTLWLPASIGEVSPEIQMNFRVNRIGEDAEFGLQNILASDSERDIRRLLRRAKQAGSECRIFTMPGDDLGAIILRHSEICGRLMMASYEEDWERANQSKSLSDKEFTQLVEDVLGDCYQIGWDEVAANMEIHSLVDRTGRSIYTMTKDFIEPIRQRLERLYAKSGTTNSKSKKSLLLERYQAVKEAFGARLRWNELKMTPELDGKALDFDTIQIQLAEETGLDFPEAHVRAVILRLASEHSYDPVKDYLDQVYSTHKDEVLPLDTLAESLLGVRDALYNTYLVKHLIGSVARRYQPGCKLDTLLVLKGKQGIKKSTFFQTLYGSDWFDSTPADCGNGKDELLRQHTHWCNELGELDGITSKKDAARMKQELANPKDTFRPPYGRNTKEYPRRFVSVGTTNADSFLVDATGDRRFWVIDLGSKVIDLGKVSKLRDKIWASAVAAYKAGVQWWLDSNEQEQSNLANQAYAVADTWEDFILAFLGQELSKGVTYTTVAQCLADSLLKIEPSKQTKADQNRCADILRRTGWHKKPKKVGGIKINAWFPPDSEEVPTPPGGNRGVGTAESKWQQGLQPQIDEVPTPFQEKSKINDEYSSGEVKIIESGVGTLTVKGEASCPVGVSTVPTPAVPTPDVDTTEGQGLKVGDKAFWSECPAHCSNFAPFEIMAIDGDYAKLDLFEKPVPIAELSR